MTLRFAANLSTMFTSLVFAGRFAAARDAGFDLVEFQFPYEMTPTDLAEKLGAAGLKAVLFNMPPGNLEAGERGLAAIPGRETEFREGVVMALEYASAAGAIKLHCMAGLVAGEADRDRMRATFCENLAHAVNEARKTGVEVLIEPINPVSMPGYFLSGFDEAISIIRAVEADCGVAPGLQLDLFHCAMMGLDPVATMERCREYIRHFQIAGAPGRNEPDIADTATRAALTGIARNFDGAIIGCEYTPLDAPDANGGWIAQARRLAGA
jgi:hydroxypyruvate isomerase